MNLRMLGAVVAYELMASRRDGVTKVLLAVTLAAVAGLGWLVWYAVHPDRGWRVLHLTTEEAATMASVAALVAIGGALGFGHRALARERIDRSFEVFAVRPVPTTVLVVGRIGAAALVASSLSLLPYIGAYLFVWRWGALPATVAPLLYRWLLSTLPAVLLLTAVGTLAGSLSERLSSAILVPVGLLAVGGAATAAMSWWFDANLGFLLDLPALSYWLPALWSGGQLPGVTAMRPITGELGPLLVQRAVHLSGLVLLVALAILYYPRRSRDVAPMTISPTGQLRSFLALYDRLRRAAKPNRDPPRLALVVATLGAVALVAATRVAVDDAAAADGYLARMQRDLDLPRTDPGLAALGLVAEVRVDVVSGTLEGHAAVQLANESHQVADGVVIALNAGLAVSSLRLDGQPAAFERVDDRIQLCFTAPLLPGEERALTVDYRGRLNAASGLYGWGRVLSPREMPTWWLLQHFRATGHGSYFRGSRPVPVYSDLLALEAAYLWLPQPLGTQVWRRATVAVTLPSELTVAAPGIAAAVAAAAATGTRRTVLATLGPVAAFDLYAARYQSFDGEVAGVPYRVHVLPSHARNLGEATDRIEDWLRALHRLGLATGLGGLTVAEVPALSYASPSLSGIVPIDERELYADGEGFSGGIDWALMRRLMPLEITGGSARKFEWALLLAIRDLLDPGSSSGSTRGANLDVGGSRQFQGSRKDGEPSNVLRLVFAGVRGLFGDSEFDALLSQFLLSHRFRAVGMADFRGFVLASRPDLGWFFEDYLDSAQLADYRAGEPRVDRVTGGYRVRVRIENLGTGRNLVPVVVVTDFARAPQTVFVPSGGSAELDLVVADPPRRVVIDPEGRTLRLKRSQRFDELDLGPALAAAEQRG